MRRNMNERIKRCFSTVLPVMAFLLLAGIFDLAASAYAVLDGQSFYQPQKADVIIIPGTMAGSVDMRERCSVAAELYKKGCAKSIIATGAQGPDESMTEARAEAKYLKGMGVKEKDVFLEERSTDTRENLSYAKKIMEREGFETAIIATSDFHIYRSVQFAKKMGITAYGAPAGMYEPMRFKITLREILAVAVYAATQGL